ncbi:MAG: acylneuraminate cytidylyltransferase [Rhodospirillaceae bacterium]|jgi:N-acylneuraminate cytidylyltransferase|nr:acylneuraminate cytidylyltransferase [Rhodospirillaceae bacterium]|tara:strand:+ start:2013 stop:2711 length:699 start_codon:yes stop_codon:yes gene_type:complete
MRVSCIIIARRGSKGIPNKNTIDFCGKPLLAWTVLQAKACELVSDIWISSDSFEILDIGERYGARPIIRPDEISGDASASEEAWLHAIEHIDQLKNGDTIDYVLTPQVTSPLREASDFSGAIRLIKESATESLLSVAAIQDFFIWKVNQEGIAYSVNYDYRDRKPRQQIEKQYLENGSFYIFKPPLLKQMGNRLSGKISMYVMERYKMFQIDNHEDIKLCEVMMKGYGLNRQ